jgi:hypothetical protein
MNFDWTSESSGSKQMLIFFEVVMHIVYVGTSGDEGYWFILK